MSWETPLLSVSTFSHQVDQCINDIARCLTSCEDIRRKRNLGRDHHHRTTALDELENSLRAGSGFISGEASRFPRLYRSDPDSIDDIGGAEFAGYITQIEDVNLQLQAIAEPSSQHRHHYRHRHLSHWLAPGWDYDAHHNHEHPHFHELRMQWERIRDGIPRTFADMDARLALREKIRIKKNEDEEKLKNAKKELDEQKKKDLKELEEKRKEDAKELEEKQKEDARELNEMEKENKKKLEKLEGHTVERLHDKEKIDQRRDVAVERMLETKLDENPIQKMEEMVHVIDHLSRAITPRTSHERIPLRVSLNSNAVASGYGMGEGGRSGSTRLLEVPVFEHQHDRSHSHYHPRHHYHRHPIRRTHSCPDLSDSDSTEVSSMHRIPRTPVFIENHINNTGVREDESIDDEVDTIIDDRGIVHRRFHHQDDWLRHRHGHQHLLHAPGHRSERVVTVAVPESEVGDLEEFVERRRTDRSRNWW